MLNVRCVRNTHTGVDGILVSRESDICFLHNTRTRESWELGANGYAELREKYTGVYAYGWYYTPQELDAFVDLNMENE